MKFEDLKAFLDQKAEEYNRPDFIENDPIQIPHQFTEKQDVEISAFFAAILAWGNRKSIIKDAQKVMDWMGNSPYDFVLNHQESDLKFIEGKPVHRTFNSEDFIHFLTCLRRVYQNSDSLESCFLLQEGETNFYHSLHRFREQFFDGNFEHRSRKHISSTYKNSSAKRLMMYLRWMVRKDKKGVDFGIWKRIDQRFLSIPLDVHTGTVSRKLNLVTRKQNDWKTVEELDVKLRKMDALDPAKYDFALFGSGVSGDL